jgi:hypothetical protein
LWHNKTDTLGEAQKQTLSMFYKVSAVSPMLYGSQSWTLMAQQRKRTEVDKTHLFNSSMVQLLEMKHNEDIRQELHTTSLFSMTKKSGKLV